MELHMHYAEKGFTTTTPEFHITPPNAHHLFSFAPINLVFLAASRGYTGFHCSSTSMDTCAPGGLRDSEENFRLAENTTQLDPIEETNRKPTQVEQWENFV
ncbi:hypothetical protein GQ457_15G026890 [Hibiscus cannabinus]